MFLQVEIILTSKLLVATKLKSDRMYFVHLKKKNSWSKLGLNALVLAIFIFRLDKHVF